MQREHDPEAEPGTSRQIVTRAELGQEIVTNAELVRAMLWTFGVTYTLVFVTLVVTMWLNGYPVF